MPQAAADAPQRRLVSFAVKIIELVGRLPKTLPGVMFPARSCVRALLQPRTTAKRGVRRAVPTSYINSESPSKSSMRPASGSSSFWKLGWPRPQWSRTSSRKIVSLPASSARRSGPSKPKPRKSANDKSPFSNDKFFWGASQFYLGVAVLSATNTRRGHQTSVTPPMNADSHRSAWICGQGE